MVGHLGDKMESIPSIVRSLRIAGDPYLKYGDR